MKPALLLIDYINPMNFGGGPAFARRAHAAAARAAILKQRARSRNVPVIYANDNFGIWTAEFSALVAIMRKRTPDAGRLVDALAPEPGDFSILKPRHSAFFGTPLEFLLDELGVTQLILAGLVTDICVAFTAHDAYMRKFELWIPADCSAAVSAREHHNAIDTLRRVAKARVRPVVDASRNTRSATPRTASPSSGGS
jgi:nicotinamidase-related amidase